MSLREVNKIDTLTEALDSLEAIKQRLRYVEYATVTVRAKTINAQDIKQGDFVCLFGLVVEVTKVEPLGDYPDGVEAYLLTVCDAGI